MSVIENTWLNDGFHAARVELTQGLRGSLLRGMLCSSTDELEQTLDALVEFNRSDYRVQLRFAVLEHVIRACSLLSRPYGVAQPDNEGDEAHWTEPMRELVREGVLGYNLIVNELLQTDPFPGYVQLLAIALERTVRFLGLLVLERYENYTMPTGQVWFALHRFFAYAEAKALQDVSVELPVRPHQGTIARAYKQILVTALADPYRLAPGHAWSLYLFLRDWVDSCEIVASTGEDSDKPYGFVVDLGSDDEAHFSLLQSDPYVSAEQHRRIELADFIVAIEGYISKLDQQGGRGAERDDPNVQRSTLQMLKRALHAWKRNSHRQAFRYQSEEIVDIVWGVDQIYQFLRSDEVAHSVATNVMAQPMMSDGDLVCCQVLNESTGGFCLNMAANVVDPANRLAVGHVVLVVTGDEAQEPRKLVCIVRWLQDQGDDGVRFGIQILGQGAQPLRVLPLSDGAAGKERNAVRILSRVTHAGGMLIAPVDLYRPDRFLLVTAETEQILVRVSALLEEGTDHVQVRYESDSPF